MYISAIQILSCKCT